MRNKRNSRFGRFSENNDPKVKISLSIGGKLLRNIEDNIDGDNRSEKVRKCAAVGYPILLKETENLKNED